MMRVEDALRASLVRALKGSHAHADVRGSVEGIDLATAGALHGGSPHSIHQILRHMIYWQDFFLSRLEGNAVPEPEEDRWEWPAAPASEREWQAVVAAFQTGLDWALRRAELPDLEAPLAGSEDATRLDAVRTIASHNSYHCGQIILLRKMMPDGPPRA
jgi:uncharacterized damage-inducible protein DinB